MVLSSCSSFINPLNLRCIFENYLAGTEAILIGLAIIFIAIMAAKFRMSMQITLVIFALFVMMFVSYLTSLVGFLFLILIVAGILGGYIVIKLIKF